MHDNMHDNSINHNYFKEENIDVFYQILFRVGDSTASFPDVCLSGGVLCLCISWDGHIQL